VNMPRDRGPSARSSRANWMRPAATKLVAADLNGQRKPASGKKFASGLQRRCQVTSGCGVRSVFRILVGGPPGFECGASRYRTGHRAVSLRIPWCRRGSSCSSRDARQSAFAIARE
jgi:hypothetical protein